jgi:signal transduction histidine kinase
MEQYKFETKSLEMANACVSHELRNPLSSIVASSIQRDFEYKLLEDWLNTDAPKHSSK